MVITENCDCENGGTCVEDDTDFVCFCPDAYYGDKCENIRGKAKYMVSAIPPCFFW